MAKKKKKKTQDRPQDGWDEWKMRLLTERLARHNTALVHKATGKSYTPADIMPYAQFKNAYREYAAYRKAYAKRLSA